MKIFTLFASLCALLFQGCVQTQVTYVERLPFPVEEYAQLGSYLEDGNAKVFGQGFFVTRSGDVKFGAGADVLLEPVTSLTTQWYEEDYKNNSQMLAGEWDKRHGPYVRKTTCDGEGRFKFKNIPDGSYYVSTEIKWEYVSGGVSIPTGGVISKKIEVKNGEDVEINLHH